MTTGTLTASPDIDALRDDLQRICILNKDIDLSSGSHAKYYFDGKAGMALPSVARKIGRLMAPIVLAARVQGMGGLELGSISVADAIGEALLDDDIDMPKFIVRKEEKTHGTKTKIEQPKLSDGLPLISPGRTVAVVDDVITKGTSVLDAIAPVEASGSKVGLIAVIVERHEGGADTLRAEGYDVVSLFRADEAGRLSVNEQYLERLSAL